MGVTSKTGLFCVLFLCLMYTANGCYKCSSCGFMDSCSGTCNAGTFKACLGLCACFDCSSSCATCSGGSSNQCQSCPTGYYLSGSSCPKCPTGCNACSSATSCSTCEDGYYVSGSSCPACDSNCLTCQTSPTYCLTCKNKYFINSNICYDCPALCATCTSLTSCQSCTDTHTNGAVCDCISGYYQSGSTCPQCQSPCQTCQSSGTYCLSCTGAHRTLTTNACPCDSGYVDISGTCQACTLPCVTCQSTQQYCTSCSDSVSMTITVGVCSCGYLYYYDNTYMCQPCTPPCENCETIDTKCTSCLDPNMSVDGSDNCICNDGYYVDTLTCIACVSPCQKCTSSTYCTQCDSSMYFTLDPTTHTCVCQDTYYLNINICFPCNLPCDKCDIGPDNCLSCVDSDQSLTASNTCVCNSGFIPNGNYCDSCNLPCTTCSGTVDTCTACVDPQQLLISNKCICSPGYGVSGTGCAVCKSPCLTCSSSINTCESCVDPSIFILSNNKCLCVDGQFANESQCSICAPECKTCFGSEDYCLSCKDINHILTTGNECICPVGYLSLAGSCLQCEPPCFACQFNPSYCTECLDPLAIVQNNKCICPDGQYQDQNFVCQDCNPLCLTCSDYNLCLTCNHYFYMDNAFMCQVCQKPCGKCNSLTSCIDCRAGQSIVGDQCQNCSLGCLECVDFSSCQLCQDGYYLNQYQQCLQCQSPCDLCQSTPTQCLSCLNSQHIVLNFVCQCKQNQYEINQNCIDCSFPCQSCISESQCLSCMQLDQIILLNQQCVCKQGYYLDGSQCLICDLTCQTCSQQYVCLSCDVQLFRQLSDSKCKCQSGYYDEGQLSCTQCTSQNGIQIEECQYSNCSDGIWTWGEQCDDGNSITRDGCSDCQIDYGYSCLNVLLQPSLCIKCIDDCKSCDQSSVCQECYDGYYLQDNQCLICDAQCKTCNTQFQCLTCNFLMINNQCRFCEDKQGYYNKNGLCITKCGDDIQADTEQCDDGNLIDGDGCNKLCQLEQGFYFQNGVALKKQFPKPVFKEIYQSFYDPRRVFTLYYEENIKYFELEFEEIFQLQIENFYYHQDYTYNITNNSVNQTSLKTQIIYQKFNITITLLLKQSTYHKQISLFMQPSQFVNQQGSAQQITSVSSKISDFQYIETGTMQKTQNTINANYYMLYFILLLIALSILFGGVEIFYNLLDLLQLVSYLQYVNTQFPYNLETFINIFSFAQFQFLDSYISISQFYQNYIDQQQLGTAPQKISDDGFSTNIINNFSSLVTIWLTFIGTYILAHIVPTLISKISVQVHQNEGEIIMWIKTIIIMFKQYVMRQCWIIKSQFFFSGFLRTFISTTYDFCFFLVLNIFSISYSGYLINRLGSYITLFFLAVYISILKLSFDAVSINYQSRVEYNKYGAIYDGLKFTPICKYFYVFLLVKKFLFMVFLILTYYDPLFQILFIFMLSLFQITYLIYFTPLEEKYEQRKQLFCEIYMAITEFLLFFLVVDDLQGLFVYETRSMIGWFCIGFISLMLLTQIVLDIHQQWSILLVLYQKIKKYILQKFNQSVPVIRDDMLASQTQPNENLQI